MNFKTSIRNSYPYRIFSLLKDYKAWARRDFAAPSPHFIKQSCLIRNSHPNSTWIETGTYLGQTTKILSKYGAKVYSIEPEPTLFANARRYFYKNSNVEILNGTSESVLPDLLPKIRGNVNFCLMGIIQQALHLRGIETRLYSMN